MNREATQAVRNVVANRMVAKYTHKDNIPLRRNFKCKDCNAAVVLPVKSQDNILKAVTTKEYTLSLKKHPQRQIPRILSNSLKNYQLLCGNYVSEILLRVSLQSEYRLDHTYLKYHRCLSSKMRSFLVQYIYKIYSKYSLKRTTLFLAVYYLDSYLSRNYNITYQSVYITVTQAALFIAMKYEEIYPPDLLEWVDHKYRKDIIRMEAEMLKTMDFRLACFTVENFVYYQLAVRQINENEENNSHSECQNSSYYSKYNSQNSDISYNSNVYNSKDNLKYSLPPSTNSLTNESSSTWKDFNGYKTLYKIYLLADLTLFDPIMHQYKAGDLAYCIVKMAEGNYDSLDHKMMLNVKWMTERNKQTMTWLIKIKYRSLINFQY